MKQLNIQVTDDQHKKLRVMAAQQETTIKHLISKALEQLLTKDKP